VQIYLYTIESAVSSYPFVSSFNSFASLLHKRRYGVRLPRCYQHVCYWQFFPAIMNRYRSNKWQIDQSCSEHDIFYQKCREMAVHFSAFEPGQGRASISENRPGVELALKLKRPAGHGSDRPFCRNRRAGPGQKNQAIVQQEAAALWKPM